MPKPLTPGQKKKLGAIAKEIIKSSNATGGPVAVNQMATFQAIPRKGTKIRLARAFATQVKAGEIEGIRIAGKSPENHRKITPYMLRVAAPAGRPGAAPRPRRRGFGPVSGADRARSGDRRVMGVMLSRSKT